MGETYNGEEGTFHAVQGSAYLASIPPGMILVSIDGDLSSTDQTVVFDLTDEVGTKYKWDENLIAPFDKDPQNLLQFYCEGGSAWNARVRPPQRILKCHVESQARAPDHKFALYFTQVFAENGDDTSLQYVISFDLLPPALFLQFNEMLQMDTLHEALGPENRRP